MATIFPVTTLEDVPVRHLPITILSTEPDPSRFELRVTTSSNPTLIRGAEIGISGAGTNWNLTLPPVANQSGTATILLRVLYDQVAVATGSFQVRVLPVNDPPVLAPIPDLEVTRGETILPIPLTLTDPDTTPGLQFSFESSNPALVSPTDLRVGGVQRLSGYLIIAPTPGIVGSATIQLKAFQAGDTQNPPSIQSFVFTVRPERFESLGAIATNAFANGVPVAADFGGPGGPLIWVPHLGMSRPVRYLPSGTNPARDSLAQVGDFDGDGRVDLMLVNTQTGMTQIWGNESDSQTNQFRLKLFFPLTNTGNAVFAFPSPLALADFDGDGDLDLLVWTATGGISGAQLYLNQGGGARFVARNIGIRTGPGVVAADFDGDGAMDVLTYRPGGVLSDTNGLAKIWHNKGNGEFEATDDRFFSGGRSMLNGDDIAGQAGVADFDGDGRMDIWMTQTVATQPYISIYLNRGRSGFEHVWQRPIGPVNASAKRIAQIGAAVADYDGDGRPDFLVFEQASLSPPGLVQPTQRVHQAFIRNLGDGNFAAPVMGLPDTGGQSWLALADFDGDGTIDPILARATNSTVRFLNVSHERNSLPGLPAALRSTYDGSQLALSWRTATDGNQTTPLTYEVRVGTAPGQGDILAALADSATGRRLAWAPGNAGFNNFLFLKLPSERFAGVKRLYWSVQAIDASLAGGGFAPEATVELSSLPPGEPPSMLPIADINLGTASSIRISTLYGDDRTPAAAIDFRVQITRPDLIDVTEADRVVDASKQEFSFRIFRRSDLAGSSEVTLTAVDSDGLSSSHTFVVTVPPVVIGPASGVIPLQYATSSAGALWLSAESAGVPVNLESSDDLVNWTPVIRGQTSAGDALFVAPSEPVRFYRQRRQ